MEKGLIKIEAHVIFTEDGARVNIKSEIEGVTTKIIVETLADAINDILEKSASEGGMSLGFVREKFLDALIGAE